MFYFSKIEHACEDWESFIFQTIHFLAAASIYFFKCLKWWKIFPVIKSLSTNCYHFVCYHLSTQSQHFDLLTETFTRKGDFHNHIKSWSNWKNDPVEQILINFGIWRRPNSLDKNWDKILWSDQTQIVHFSDDWSKLWKTTKRHLVWCIVYESENSKSFKNCYIFKRGGNILFMRRISFSMRIDRKKYQQRFRKFSRVPGIPKRWK